MLRCKRGLIYHKYRLRSKTKLARTTCFAASGGIRVAGASIRVKYEPDADGLDEATIEISKMVVIRLSRKSVAGVQ